MEGVLKSGVDTPSKFIFGDFVFLIISTVPIYRQRSALHIQRNISLSDNAHVKAGGAAFAAVQICPESGNTRFSLIYCSYCLDYTHQA
jgi:hypothetical protein